LKPSEIKNALEGASLLYVDGGNTFYLQKHLTLSKFWEYADEVLKNGCVYVGCSAGAIVAGKYIPYSIIYFFVHSHLLALL